MSAVAMAISPASRGAIEAAARFQEHVAKRTAYLMAVRGQVLEELVVEAVQLQDYERLDDLHIVDQAGCGPAVASKWWGHPYWWAERAGLVPYGR